MSSDIKHYVKTCPVCQTVKSDHAKKTGTLQPLTIPARMWQQVTTDLCTDLPGSAGYSAIAVFVDRLSTMVHFAQCTKEVTTEEHAQLFMDSVFRHHTMQEAIILTEIRGSSEEFGLLQW